MDPFAARARLPGESMTLKHHLSLVLISALLAGCGPISGLLDPSNLSKAKDVLASGDVQKLLGLGGQLLPPPKLLNDNLAPIFVNALNGKAPSLEDVKAIVALTTGQKVGSLPKEAGQNGLTVKVNKGASAFGVLMDGPFRLFQASQEVSVGLGEAPPYYAQQAAVKDAANLADAPIFAAKSGLSRRYGVLALPSAKDLRPKMPPIRDQGARGTCALFSAAAILDYMYADAAAMGIKHASPEFMDWLYQIEVKSKHPEEKSKLWTDTGTVRELFYPLLHVEGNRKVGTYTPYVPPQQGYLAEGDCPYNEKLAPAPASTAAEVQARKQLGEALATRIAKKETFKSQGAYFFKVKSDLPSFKAALAGGQPIHIGFPIYDADWDEPDPARRYAIPEMTEAKAADGAKIGYHAVVLAGYEDDAKAPGGGWFLVRNSWGPDWGEQGYCRVSYRFAMDYGSGPHIATPYAKPFQATYDLLPPPKEAPPVAQEKPLPTVQDVTPAGGYTPEVVKQEQDSGEAFDFHALNFPDLPIGDILSQILNGK
jgi:hypothetical protein